MRLAALLLVLLALATRRPSWTCSACAVEVTLAPGFELPEGTLPRGFAEVEDGALRCLDCRRAALRASLPEDASSDAVAEAFIVFELDRNLEGDTDREVGARLRAAGLGLKQVTTNRVKEVRLARELAPPEPSVSEGRGSHAEQARRREAIEAELRRDPRRSNREIAAQLGGPESTVSRVRRRLEAEGEIEKHRASKWTSGRAAA